MKQWQRGHKFKAVRTEYAGLSFPSILEANVAQMLDQDPDVIWWLRQVGVDLGPDRRFMLDFICCRSGPTYCVEGVEAKGRETTQWKSTRKLWAKYGPFPLRVIKRSGRAGLRTHEVIVPGGDM